MNSYSSIVGNIKRGILVLDFKACKYSRVLLKLFSSYRVEIALQFKISVVLTFHTLATKRSPHFNEDDYPVKFGGSKLYDQKNKIQRLRFLSLTIFDFFFEKYKLASHCYDL
jgi:hypothetical protein